MPVSLMKLLVTSQFHLNLLKRIFHLGKSRCQKISVQRFHFLSVADFYGHVLTSMYISANCTVPGIAVKSAIFNGNGIASTSARLPRLMALDFKVLPRGSREGAQGRFACTARMTLFGSWIRGIKQSLLLAFHRQRLPHFSPVRHSKFNDVHSKLECAHARPECC